MSRNDGLNFDSELAAQKLPELELTVKELQQCLKRFETLNKKFRRDFLKLFRASATPFYADNPARRVLRNAHFSVRANLFGNALSHLTYVVDSADLACGVIASLYRRQ